MQLAHEQGPHRYGDVAKAIHEHAVLDAFDEVRGPGKYLMHVDGSAGIGMCKLSLITNRLRTSRGLIWFVMLF